MILMNRELHTMLIDVGWHSRCYVNRSLKAEYKSPGFAT